MTPPTPPTRRVPPRPTTGPTPSSLADKRDFEMLADSSLDTVRKSAESWRNGTSALIALVTGGLLIKGPEDAAKLSVPGRLAVTVLLGAGLLAAIVALWKMLAAAAGTPKVRTLPELVQTYGSVKAATVASAIESAATLKNGRKWAVGSLVLFLVGLGTWWWASPTVEDQHRIVVTLGGTEVCGELQSADKQTLVVKVSGEKDPHTIAMSEVENIRLATTCEKSGD